MIRPIIRSAALVVLLILLIGAAMASPITFQTFDASDNSVTGITWSFTGISGPVPDTWGTNDPYSRIMGYDTIWVDPALVPTDGSGLAFSPTIQIAVNGGAPVSITIPYQFVGVFIGQEIISVRDNGWISGVFPWPVQFDYHAVLLPGQQLTSQLSMISQPVAGIGAVPEPGTLGLIGIGLIGVAAMRRISRLWNSPNLSGHRGCETEVEPWMNRKWLV